jgi:hypothetical protein
VPLNWQRFYRRLCIHIYSYSTYNICQILWCLSKCNFSNFDLWALKQLHSWRFSKLLIYIFCLILRHERSESVYKVRCNFVRDSSCHMLFTVLQNELVSVGNDIACHKIKKLNSDLDYKPKTKFRYQEVPGLMLSSEILLWSFTSTPTIHLHRMLLTLITIHLLSISYFFWASKVNITPWCMIFLEKFIVPHLVSTFPAFMEPKVSLPWSRKSPLVPVLNQINPVYIFVSYFVKW